MRSQFILIFIFVLFFGNCLCTKCYHCKETEHTTCVHPDHYVPPITFCGATSAGCMEVRLILTPTPSTLWMSFGDKSSWAIFRGCGKEDACKEILKPGTFEKVGIKALNCSICETDLCNSVARPISLVTIKLFVFEIIFFNI
ncbi:hypothetical protein ILUMI_00494 [Ignelater luminosus]|uniref:Protein sleepless n=1 Tax=Ignelater luminosus TaxID=2038154 RepID=A0A8K0GML0_IGNLU|nr:hypothetical protein ILUMI_00494 [Ignelater luminosus]